MAEAEAKRLAEEKAIAEANAAKEVQLKEQTQDAYAVISDLDNALKAFQGALGLSDVRYNYSTCRLTPNVDKGGTTSLVCSSPMVSFPFGGLKTKISDNSLVTSSQKVNLR